MSCLTGRETVFLLKKERIPGSALTKCHQFNRSWFVLQKAEQGNAGRFRQLAWDFSIQFLKSPLRQILKGWRKKDVRNVLYCSISMSVSHVPGNQGGFLQKINCHCSSYSNHYSYVLEKPRNITHYLTLEEVGNCNRSVTNFFHVVCFDLWSSYDLETCILLRKSTDAARRLKRDMPPDIHIPSWCLAPALWRNAAPH